MSVIFGKGPHEDDQEKVTFRAPQVRQRPEEKIQKAIIAELKSLGWVVKRMAASMYMSGVPDIYATHSLHGGKWIEVKLPKMEGSRFTRAQLKTFPEWLNNGTPIYILTSVADIDLLYGEHNAWKYLKAHYLGYKL